MLKMFVPNTSELLEGCLLTLQQQLPPQFADFSKQRWSGMFYGLSLVLAAN